MSKLATMREAISTLVPDGSSVVLGCQLEQMIPFAAGHEIMRQNRRGLTLIGPISDILFDQMIGAGCAERVIAAWVGNVMMGSAYNFRCAVEREGLKVTDMTNFTVALALQAAATGVPFLPTLSALGSDVARDNEFFAEIESPFGREKLHAVKALHPDVTIVHVQRADAEGNAHCWGNFGIMLEAVKAAKRVIVTAEEIVAPEVIASDPNRTVIPGFLVSAVVEAPLGHIRRRCRDIVCPGPWHHPVRGTEPARDPDPDAKGRRPPPVYLSPGQRSGCPFPAAVC